MKYKKVENHVALFDVLELKAKDFRTAQFMISFYRAIAAFFALANDETRAEKFTAKCSKMFTKLHLDDAMRERLAKSLASACSCNYNAETLRRYAITDSLERNELHYATQAAYYVLYNEDKKANVACFSKNIRIRRSQDKASSEYKMRNLLLLTLANASTKLATSTANTIETKLARVANVTAIATIEKSTDLSSDTTLVLASDDQKELVMSASN